MDFDMELPNLPSAKAVWFGKKEKNFLPFGITE